MSLCFRVHQTSVFQIFGNKKAIFITKIAFLFLWLSAKSVTRSLMLSFTEPHQINLQIYYSSTSFESIKFVKIPRINAHATVRISTAPKLTTIPPTPVMKITDATKRFLFLLRSTVWNILNPDTAMNP